MRRKQYRLLNVGEKVQDMDQEYSADELNDDTLSPEPRWRDVAVEFIGEAVQENDPPVRRAENPYPKAEVLNALKMAEGVVEWAIDNGAKAKALHKFLLRLISKLEV